MTESPQRNQSGINAKSLPGLPDGSAPVSVCIISGEEERRIGRALASVAGWAREIIIVLNADARDGTEKIALQYGAKVFRESWQGFQKQKNSVLEKATQDWVFGLDADEEVSVALRDEIFATIGSAAANPDSKTPTAFSVPRCSFYCGRWIRHGDWYPDRCLRLWRRGQGRWVGADPHPQVQIDGRIGKLRADLNHYPMESINQQISKTVAYADDFVKLSEKTGRRAGWLDLTIRPVWRFLRAYFIRLGFLDGWPGLSIAWMTAFYTFLRYVRVMEAEENRRKHS